MVMIPTITSPLLPDAKALNSPKARSLDVLRSEDILIYRVCNEINEGTQELKLDALR
jgi:hypothetical protein